TSNNTFSPLEPRMTRQTTPTLSNLTNRSLGRSPRARSSHLLQRACQPVLAMESLESRRLLAAPEIAPLPFRGVAPAGKSLPTPELTNDADDDSVTLTAAATAANAAQVNVEFLPQDNTYLEMDVAGLGTMTFQLF